MHIVVLHLSDIHIRSREDDVLRRAAKIASTTFPILPNASAIIICVSGDIAYSGKAAEYELAEHFIQEIITTLKKETSTPIHVITVPGNHDGEFSKPNPIRRSLLHTLRERDGVSIDAETIEACTAPQSAYFEFARRIQTTAPVFDDQLWSQYEIQISTQKLAISAINASWASEVPELPGRLVFPQQKYEDICARPALLKIAVMHHPLNWYTQDTYHPLRKLIRQTFHFCITGHEHTPSTLLVDDFAGGQCVSLETGAVAPQPDAKESELAVTLIDLERNVFATEQFKWRDHNYAPSDAFTTWSDLRPIPTKRSADFSFEREWEERLEDVGANFTHTSVKHLKLSHIFVYPNLEPVDSDDDRPTYENAEILVRRLDDLKKVIVRGEEQSGKSSLLRRLAAELRELGYVPVIASPQDFADYSDGALRRGLDQLVRKQYGKEAVQRFERLERSRKVLLLDNLNSASDVKADIPHVLEQIDAHFDYAVITVGHRFDLENLVSPRTSAISSRFKQFRIRGFGYRLRSELMARWYQVGGPISPVELQTRVHNAESIVDSVIGKGLVQPNAFNVLVLLQALEVGQQATLSNAGFAQYYEHLIRQSLLTAGAKPDELDEHLTYLSHFAWALGTEKSLNEAAFASFNDLFSREIYRTDLDRRRDLLRHARILVEQGGDYAFQYPYLRYFFRARYIAAYVDDDPTLRSQVLHACQHLYTRENANTVLFLSHHIKGAWLIDEIANILYELLSEISPFQFDGPDVKTLNGWVQQTARIAVDARNTTENRRHQRDREDDADRIPERDSSTEVASANDLDWIAKIHLLFRTSEILGQVLKNRYGSLSNHVKANLLNGIFVAALRATKVFTSIVEDEPEALLESISDKFRERNPKLEKDKADRIAQMFVFSSLGAMADAFFSRQGSVVGSPKLRELIESATKTNGTMSYRLLAVAARLSYPGQIPTDEIERLATELKGNVFGFKLLQGLVARHIYMFELKQEERQRLGDAVNIEVRSQMTMSLKAQGDKTLPGKGKRPQHSKALILRLQDTLLGSIKKRKSPE